VNLDRLSIIPYELELRNTLDAALYHWSELKASAEMCLLMEAKWRKERKIEAADMNQKVREQSRIFDCLDGFLSAWARVSLVFFPTGKGEFTQGRGAVLRDLFQLDESSPVNSRGLRNAWMHNDERLDILVSQGRRGAGQRFVNAADVTADMRETHLRLIELDTLVVHYQDHDGTPQSVSLHSLHDALAELDERQKTAFDDLQVPDDQDAT
jgi:hypothetical protein